MNHYLKTILILMSPLLLAVTERGRIEQVVLSALRIEKISDMKFPDAVAGDDPYTIVPSQGETFQNASFDIYGEANKSFRIILPSNGKVKLRIKNHYAGNAVIDVNKFQSNYSNNFGRIKNNGKASLYVGATRSELKLNQRAGRYQGRFNISVVY